jgi:hypothetical protein
MGLCRSHGASRPVSEDADANVQPEARYIFGKAEICCVFIALKFAAAVHYFTVGMGRNFGCANLNPNDSIT